MDDVNQTFFRLPPNIDEAEQIELPRKELTEEDQDLKAMFITLLLENLTH